MIFCCFAWNFWHGTEDYSHMVLQLPIKDCCQQHQAKIPDLHNTLKKLCWKNILRALFFPIVNQTFQTYISHYLLMTLSHLLLQNTHQRLSLLPALQWFDTKIIHYITIVFTC